MLQEFQFCTELDSRLSVLQRGNIILGIKNLLAHELDCLFIIAHLALMVRELKRLISYFERSQSIRVKERKIDNKDG